MKNIFFTLTVDEQVFRMIIFIAKRRQKCIFLTILLKNIDHQAKHRTSKAFWKKQFIVKKKDQCSEKKFEQNMKTRGLHDINGCHKSVFNFLLHKIFGLEFALYIIFISISDC